MNYNKDGLILGVAGGYAQGIHLFDINKKILIKSILDSNVIEGKYNWSIAFSNLQNRYATGAGVGQPNEAFVDLRDTLGSLLHSYYFYYFINDGNFPEAPGTLCFSNDDKYLVCGEGTGAVLLNSIWIPSDIIEPVMMNENNYPNPATNTIHIFFSLPIAGNTTILIFDGIGKQMTTLFKGFLNLGEQSIDWDTSTQPSGTYFCKIQCGSYSKTINIAVEH